MGPLVGDPEVGEGETAADLAGGERSDDDEYTPELNSARQIDLGWLRK